MRECKTCLHLEETSVVGTFIAQYSAWCKKNNKHISHACDGYWPKEGAKCKTCRLHDLEDDSCHLSRHVHITTKEGTFVMDTRAIRTNNEWFCENWKARE